MSTDEASGSKFRHIAPAPADFDPNLERLPEERDTPTRRVAVKNACTACQARKTKCDGVRPACSRCQRISQPCHYDVVHEGLTKSQSLKAEIARISKRVEDLERTIHILEHASLEEATALLASIRLNAERSSQRPLLGRSSDPPQFSQSSEHVNEFSPIHLDRQDWDVGTQLSSDITSPPEGHDGSFPSQSSSFRNLPFSSAVRANYYPAEIQQRQVDNMFTPLWAILPMNTLPGQASVTSSVSATLREARNLIRSGHSPESVIGRQCNIAAVYDQKQYDCTTLLSKWAAGIIFSIQYKNRDFVTFAMMHLMWTLARWMIEPRPDTYEALPDWYKPTLNQLFVPHVEMVDFLNWPALRDCIINNPTLQDDFKWLLDMSTTLDCEWLMSPEAALEQDELTGEFHLTQASKNVVEELGNWFVGPSTRRFIPNVDFFVRIEPGLYRAPS